MSSEQPQLFEYDLPAKKQREIKPTPEAVDRQPGWFYVSKASHRADLEGVWHRVKRLADNDKIDVIDYGSVRTACGITGRIVSEECERIALCEECKKLSS